MERGDTLAREAARDVEPATGEVGPPVDRFEHGEMTLHEGAHCVDTLSR